MTVPSTIDDAMGICQAAHDLVQLLLQLETIVKFDSQSAIYSHVAQEADRALDHLKKLVCENEGWDDANTAPIATEPEAKTGAETGLQRESYSFRAHEG